MSAIQHLLTKHFDIWTAADTGPKSGRGRSSANAASVYGIRKLRELILELAVRGKLVPQDAGDEPASELLKRIQAEKAKLAEGKTKKEKPLLPITGKEKPADLPGGWVCARLADLVNVLNGRAYKKEELLDAGTPVLRVGNLFTSDHWYYSDLSLEEDKYCNNGDLLFAWSASFGPFIWDGAKSIYHYHIWKLDLYGGDLLYKRYLYTFLLEQTQKIKASGHGVMMIHMTKEKMEKLVVYLPPVSEQHRIVAKVDELMALCDKLEAEHNNASEAHEKLVSHLLGTLTQSQSAEEFSANWQRIAAHFDALFTTEASIDALKQTLLQLAVMGKLVPQNKNDEPASELLKRIQAEKAKLISSGKIKKEKLLSGVATDKNAVGLPKGWASVRLGDIVSIRGGSTPSMSKSEYWGGKVLWVSPKDMHDGPIVDSELKVTDKALKETGLELVPVGSILIVGRSGILKRKLPAQITSVPCTINQDIKAITPINPLSSRYMQLILWGNEKEILSRDVKQGTTVQSLVYESLFSRPLSLPPAAEQMRIVSKVDELLALCDDLKSRLGEAGQLQKNLADVLVENVVAVKAQSENSEKADGKTNQATARTLLAAEVVHQLKAEARMGRVKLQKVVNLAEYIANLKEVASEPMRNAAGPHDPHFMDQVLQGMKDRQWYEEQSVDGGKSYRYRPLTQAGQHRADYEALWSPEQRRKIHDLIELMRSWKTDQCERVATLYAAWNDLLIEGRKATEAAILHEVMNRWNDSKLNYTEAQWQKELAAMKKHALLIPTGFGRRTAGGTQTLPFH